MTIDDRDLRMEDLARATGFSERRIRYYVTRGLVPGSGERGRDATYGEATLDRLLLVRRLKGVKVGPAGRGLTLDEIAGALATTPPETARRVARGEEPVEAVLIAPEAMVRREDLHAASPQVLPPGRIAGALFSMRAAAPAGGREALEQRWSDIRPLLRQLHEALAAMGEPAPDGPAPRSRVPGRGWRRLGVPDLEIQVREPTSEEARRRLRRLAATLGDLLSRAE